MFKSLHTKQNKILSHSGRSLVGETLQIEGDVKSSGSVDVAGLINGNVFVNEMIIVETGSIRGTLEVKKVEINGHVDGKITADNIIIGGAMSFPFIKSKGFEILKSKCETGCVEYASGIIKKC